MFVLLLLFSAISCETFAVLLSGIGPWDQLGYSSEASIYQTYYYLVHGGIKRDNIILFTMNSIAYNPSNPYPGEIYAYEGGPNVYDEVKSNMDYIDYENSPQNFLKLLSGEDMTGIGSGRGLQNMTEDDDLFIVSMMHGETGMFFYYYENTSVPADQFVMWGSDVVDTVKKMQREKRFKNLVWFVCSCYGGSSFAGQFEDTDNVFIATAAPATTSAFACDSSETIGTYLSCCFFQNWQSYLREHFEEGKSLMEQFIYSYMQKSNMGASAVEEYCYYGNEHYAKTTKITDIEGQPSKNKMNKKVYSSRKLDIVENSMIRMKDVRLGKKTINDRPTPFPGWTQLVYSGFDQNYETCQVRKKMDLKCVNSLFKKIFSSGDQKLIQCSQEEEVLDFIKLACSDGVKTTVDEIYKMLKQYPCN